MKINIKKFILLAIVIFIPAVVIGGQIDTNNASAITCSQGQYIGGQGKETTCFTKCSSSGSNGGKATNKTTYDVKNWQGGYGSCDNGYASLTGLAATYDDGSAITYKCSDNKAEMHADGDCFYKSIGTDLNGTDKIGDSCKLGALTGPTRYDGHYESNGNGGQHCVAYKSADKAVMNEQEHQEAIKATPTEQSCNAAGNFWVKNKSSCATNKEDYCNQTYQDTINRQKGTVTKDRSSERAACIKGANGDCSGFAPGSAEEKACNDGKTANNGSSGGQQGNFNKCGQAKTNIIACDGSGIPALASVLKIALFILTLIIGIVAVGAVVYAAILYASAEDNAGQVSKAKGMIRDVAIGLFLYGFMIAIINWLIPGGVI